MSFDAPFRPARRVAIIGGGISGLAACWLLSRNNAVTLYEAEPRLGGHARTVMAGKRGDQPVDTGFIVFNYANYPHLTRMFQDLDVPVAKSNMSFGASIDHGRIEYGLEDLGALLAQRRNLARPGFLRMLRDILRFNARAEAFAKDTDATIGDLMSELQLGRWFRDYYLVPLSGAIWSTPPEQILSFPARALVQFFRNHALLSAQGQHQWWTVEGGSREYVSRLEAALKAQGADLRVSCPVRSVRRTGGLVAVVTDGAAETFDEVIFACHSDQALRLLDQPTETEHRALSAIRFQDNAVYLHRDVAQMPKRRKVWSSWVYQAETGVKRTQIGVSYWMNRLQNIPEEDPLFITLNPARDIPDHLVYDQNTFRHPVFDLAALKAQGRLREMQGQNNTWFAGAYTRHGFHEDGFASAVRIARALDRREALAA
ncbi:MAG: cyclopropane-fatty-acyl-phospholipid synthase [Rhodobacteraceae bacterium CG17_big_fil_post_rev_8_21_14_2_50_65_11]|nr:MAG: cyclopropane-fatty-acyl-phospholipid synthase [Rhodobacteraceae bacterium CG17_big_fil_post_rev_8_21_14_2_50_65_11]